MDRTVPTGAALLLAFVYETETSRTPPECYEVIYGHRQDRLSKPLTRMTVDEVIAAQRAWSRSHGSSAAGAPQFIRKTLIGLKEELGLRGSQILDANLQDRLAYHLLIRRGYHQFVNGEIDRTEFGRRLAGEWASFPVLDATRGAHRHVQRGQSYYAGDSSIKHWWHRRRSRRFWIRSMPWQTPRLPSPSRARCQWQRRNPLRSRSASGRGC